MCCCIVSFDSGFTQNDYGDNSGNVLIASSVTRALAQTGSWDLQLVRCLLAEARTTGKHGYREGSIGASRFRSKGWRAFFNNNVIPHGGNGADKGSQPHYGAHLSAAFLWAGHATGLKKLLSERAEMWCSGLMAGYLKGEWQWNESISNELAQMLLPLAWLVRVRDTKLHRHWLHTVLQDLLAAQDKATGAIRQAFGTGNFSGRCSPCAPKSNAEYGSGEAPLLDHFGNETISDALCE
jgi:hypothetical protein